MVRLLGAQARRDRWQLLVWIGGSGVFAMFAAVAIASEFAGRAARVALVMLASSNPALLAIRGISDGASIGALVTFQVFTYLAILAALMSTFLTVRHSRGDEERGRAELIGATPVSRSSSLLATLLLGTLANAGIAIVIAAGLAVTGLPLTGSMLSGVAAGAVGLAFCGIAAITAQLARSSRVANSLAGATIGLAFLLRAIGDAAGQASANGLRVTSAWPSWLSPIGWGQQLRPFGEAAAWPLLLDLALGAVAGAGAVALARRRDLGSGILGERPGPARASASLSGTFGLAVRLHRGAIIGWSIGAAVLGVFSGGLADTALAVVTQNPSMQAAVRGLVPGATTDLLDTVIAAVMAILGVLAAGVGVQAVLRARTEESEGRSELVLAGAVHRGRVVVDAVAVAVLSILIVLAVGGVSAGLAFIASGHADRVGISLAAAFVQFPAAVTFATVTALMLVLMPRLVTSIGWSLLALGFVIGQFGGLFGLPDWVRNISPFTHTPILTGPELHWWPAMVVLVVAFAAGLAAVILTRRRGLVT